MKTIRPIPPLFHQILKRLYEASNVFIKSDLEDDAAQRIDLYKNEEPERRLSALRSLSLRGV